MRAFHYGTAQLDGRRNYHCIGIVLSNTVAEELKNFTNLDETTKIWIVAYEGEQIILPH